MLQAQEQWDGVNPFKMGVVASSDSHTGVMGWHPETQDWPGHLGIDDAWPDGAPLDHPEQLGRPLRGVGRGELARLDLRGAQAQGDLRHQRHPDSSCGSSAAGTSPTTCASTNFVPTGYAMGVPMGGDLPARPSRKRRRASSWPPGRTTSSARTWSRSRSSRAGWTGTGEKQEKVYRVAGDSGNPQKPEAGIDQRPARPRPGGFERLCQVWDRPGLQPERARLLLRARAREARVPLQHPLVPRCGSASIRST